MTAISVVMGVYNGGATLAPTLDSILGQTEGDFEMIVVDDGSTGQTPRLLVEYARLPRARAGAIESRPHARPHRRLRGGARHLHRAA